MNKFIIYFSMNFKTIFYVKNYIKYDISLEKNKSI